MVNSLSPVSFGSSVRADFFFLNIYLFIWLRWVLVAIHGIFVATLIVACGVFSCGMWVLVPCPGIKLGPPALGVWSLSHWTTREVPEQMLTDFVLRCKMKTSEKAEL